MATDSHMLAVPPAKSGDAYIGEPFIFSADVGNAIFERAAVSGSVWGIGCSFLFCVIAVAFVTTNFRQAVLVDQSNQSVGHVGTEKLTGLGQRPGWDCRLLLIVMAGILFNVTTVVACFKWLGWQLGAIEAVTLSILVLPPSLATYLNAVYA